MPAEMRSIGFDEGVTNGAAPVRGDYYLFVIAIDKYEDAKIIRSLENGVPVYEPTFPSLANPVKDAAKLVNILVDKYRFDDDETGSSILKEYTEEIPVVEYNTLHTKCLYNQNATAENITAHLQALATAIRSQDCLLIYFSGHGDDDAINRSGYLIPYDGVAKKNRSNTWFPFSSLYTLFDFPTCRDLLIILDCCFAGRAMLGATVTIADEFARHVLVSSLSHQPAKDGRPGQGSPFANALQFILQDNSFGSASLDIDKLKSRFISKYKEMFDEEPAQQIIYSNLPTTCGHGEFVFQLKDKDRPQPDMLTQSFIKDLNFTKQKSLLEEKFDTFDDAGLNLIVTRESDKYVHELLRAVLFNRLCQFDAEDDSCMKLNLCTPKPLSLDVDGKFDVWNTLIRDTKTELTPNPKGYATDNILGQLLAKPMIISFYSDNLTQNFTSHITRFCKEFTEQLNDSKKRRADAGFKDEYYYKLFFVVPDSRDKGEDFFKEEELVKLLDNQYNLFINTPVEELAKGHTLDWFAQVKQHIGAQKIQDLKPLDFFPKDLNKKYVILDFIYKVCDYVKVDKTEIQRRIIN